MVVGGQGGRLCCQACSECPHDESTGVGLTVSGSLGPLVGARDHRARSGRAVCRCERMHAPLDQDHCQPRTRTIEPLSWPNLDPHGPTQLRQQDSVAQFLTAVLCSHRKAES